MTSRYSSVLRRIGCDASEAIRFGRFINNPKVNSEHILSHYWSSLGSKEPPEHVLVLSDTSTLSFNAHANRQGLSSLGENTPKAGFDIHPSLLVDADHGGCYGLGGLTFFQKSRSQEGEAVARRKARRKDVWKIPFEDKESFKWFESPSEAINNFGSGTRYTLVGDRESDSYTLIARTLEQGWDFIYRSKQDRLLADRGEDDRTLYRLMDDWPVKAHYELELRQTRKRSAHTALMELKFGTVSIKKPKTNSDEGVPNQLDLQVVFVQEHPDTVVKGEEPVRWILLSSHPVTSIEEAKKIIAWYQLRWIIEQLFRSLKTQGMKIEASEVETFHGLKNLTCVAMIAAVQVMQLVQARAGHTTQQLETVFDSEERACIKTLNAKLEGKTDKLKNPHQPRNLAYATWVIARLGGWNGYQSQRPPGPITITRGLARFFNILEGFSIATQLDRSD